jgi:hypothetical protein
MDPMTVKPKAAAPHVPTGKTIAERKSVMKIRVSQSSLRQWRRCRRAFYYKYILELQPRSIVRPLTFGKAIHKIIEYHIEGKTLDEALKAAAREKGKVFSADVEEFDQIMLDARIIGQAYMDFHKGDKMTYLDLPPKLDADRPRKSEHEFVHDIGAGVIIEGVIDCIPVSGDGRKWIGEHKSHKSFPTEDVRASDLQAMLYGDAASKELGLKRVVGVMWDYVRSKSPQQPALLKNGTLSKARIDTLPVMYEQAIKDHGLDRAHYVDILGDLDDKLPSWFRRVFLPFNKHAVAAMIEETQVTGREMNRKAGVDTTRNLTRDCSWCSYEKLCKAELFGQDGEWIKQREFVVAKPKIEVETE